MRTCITALDDENTVRKRCHMHCSHGRTIMADTATHSLTTDMPLLRAGLRIAADSCSLIFLNRLHLLEAYAGVHTIVLTEALYNEITLAPENKITADDRSLYTKIFAGSLAPVRVPETSDQRTRGAFSTADQSLIQAYTILKPDGMLTDDRGLCQYCRKHAIPWINSPMALFVLLYNGHLLHAEYATALQALYDMGRYGQFVHDYMEKLYVSYCACTDCVQ